MRRGEEATACDEGAERPCTLFDNDPDSDGELPGWIIEEMVETSIAEEGLKASRKRVLDRLLEKMTPRQRVVNRKRAVAQARTMMEGQVLSCGSEDEAEDCEDEVSRGRGKEKTADAPD